MDLYIHERNKEKSLFSANTFYVLIHQHMWANKVLFIANKNFIETLNLPQYTNSSVTGLK